MQSLPVRGIGAFLRWPPAVFSLAIALLLLSMGSAWAHGVAEGDKGFIQESTGVMLIPFVYMGAKHMITGYDHLLFLFGVIFFLYRLKDVGPLDCQWWASQFRYPRRSLQRAPRLLSRLWQGSSYTGGQRCSGGRVRW